jgi:hypothetical protein
MKNDAKFGWETLWTNSMEVQSMALNELKGLGAALAPVEEGLRGGGPGVYLIRLRQHLSRKARRRFSEELLAD